ncbi:hypothetical protein QE152_g31925 [Popillia japonica]|uniref:Uncharacterized protein n=1 Tax=Popillia japonica TaxID=7064 RepID=A0AAW1J0J0_POPJA
MEITRPSRIHPLHLYLVAVMNVGRMDITEETAQNYGTLEEAIITTTEEDVYISQSNFKDVVITMDVEIKMQKVVQVFEEDKTKVV